MKLRKILSALAIICIFATSTSVFATAKSIIINGQEAVIPEEMGTIKELDSRTFVPVRFIMEYLGCSVDYIDSESTAVISSSTSIYLVQEGNTSLYVIPDQYSQTKVIPMDTAAFIENIEIDGQLLGRMYLPIRFLAEAIGYNVGWNAETQTVTLDMK